MKKFSFLYERFEAFSGIKVFYFMDDEWDNIGFQISFILRINIGYFMVDLLDFLEFEVRYETSHKVYYTLSKFSNLWSL